MAAVCQHTSALWCRGLVVSAVSVDLTGIPLPVNKKATLEYLKVLFRDSTVKHTM